MAPGNLVSMRAFIIRNASDSGELSGAAVDTRISVWASATGAILATARAAAAARIRRLMVFSPQLIKNALRSITQQPGSLADENKDGCA
jgi:hypothetical protein